jgi:hypothetical protein
MRKKELLLFILLLAALTPYILLCFYALPYADDFCYAWSSAEPISFAARFMKQYMGWSGRYSAHILLCSHPLAGGRMLYYHLADLISLLSVAFAFIVFFWSVRGSILTGLITALTVLLFYLCYMPQLSDGVYWYTGVCNYELSSVCFLLHLSLLILWHRSKGLARAISFLIASLLLIASIGFNEVGAALIPSYYFFAVVILYLGKKKNIVPNSVFSAATILFCISVISFGFLVLAPGNHVRSHQFHTHFEFLHSVLFGGLQTVRFTAIWICTIPALLFSLLIISKADKLPDTTVSRFDHRLILALIVFTVFMSAFLPYFTTGILGQHRTINYSFFYTILLWMWWLISVSKQYALYEKQAFQFIRQNSPAIVAVCIVLMIFTANGGKIVRDLRADTFTAYDREYYQREDDIIHHPEIPIGPLKNTPQSLMIVDAQTDTTYWVNRAIWLYTKRIVAK